MKNLILITALLFSLQGFAANLGNGGKQTNKSKIEVYYFHYTARCITCKTVEEQTKKDLEDLYSRMMKDGSIKYQALNLEEPSGKAIGEKLKVSGQTLLLVKGEKKINITNEGFLYAVTNPVKLKSIIKQKVDSLLEL